MTEEEVKLYREQLNVTILGENCPRPVKEFSQCGLSAHIIDLLIKSNYIKMMPIQAQLLPALLAGRDVITIAELGAGKTLAYIIAIIRHIQAQPALETTSTMVAMIVVPTRELALNIFFLLKMFAHQLGFRSSCVIGGVSRTEQINTLQQGVEIVICTLGRMTDLLKMHDGNIINLSKLSFIVFEEADRLLSMGYDPQTLLPYLSSNVQTAMFCFRKTKDVEVLANEFLKDPITITHVRKKDE